MSITLDEAIRRSRMFILSILTPRFLIMTVVFGVIAGLIGVSVSGLLIFAGMLESEAGRIGFLTAAVTAGILALQFGKTRSQ